MLKNDKKIDIGALKRRSTVLGTQNSMLSKLSEIIKA